MRMIILSAWKTERPRVKPAKASLQIHHAAIDERINAAWPAYEKAMVTSKIRYEGFTYPGAQHGFNNGTTPRYDEAAAKSAWQRTIVFFNRTLRP